MAEGLGTYPLFLRVKEVAKELRMCERTVWNLIDTAGLPVHRIGRMVRINRHDLGRWLDTRKKKEAT